MRFLRFAPLAALFAILSVNAVYAQPLPPGARISGTPTADGGSFVHITRSGTPDVNNIFGNSTRLISEFPVSNSSPMTDHNPNAVIFTTYNASRSTANQTQYTAVYQEGDFWSIFNEDSLETFAEGVAFNVQVQGKSDAVFVHTSSAANTDGQVTYIDNPLTNDNPSALLSVTQYWGSTEVYNPHAIGVYYEGTRWAIFNQSIANIPLGAKFNVQVLEDPDINFTQLASDANVVSTSKTVIDNPYLNNNASVQFIVTQNWSLASVYNAHPIGVEYDAGSSRWRIINTDGAAMPVGAGFNIHITNSGDVFGDGVLINGDFEAPGAAGKSYAAKWNSDAAGSGSKRVCDKYAPKSPATKIVSISGECSFLLTGVPGQLRTLSQSATVADFQTGDQVDLLGWFNAAGVSGFKAKVKITLTNSNKTGFSLPSADLNGTYDWKAVNNSILLPPGTAATKVKVTFSINGPGKVYIDRLSSAVTLSTR